MAVEAKSLRPIRSAAARRRGANSTKVQIRQGGRLMVRNVGVPLPVSDRRILTDPVPDRRVRQQLRRFAVRRGRYQQFAEKAREKNETPAPLRDPVAAAVHDLPAHVKAATS